MSIQKNRRGKILKSSNDSQLLYFYVTSPILGFRYAAVIDRDQRSSLNYGLEHARYVYNKVLSYNDPDMLE